MSAIGIFPPIQTAKIVNPDGTATSQLLLFLNQLLNRTGGALGGSYQTLTVTSGDIIWDVSGTPIAAVQLANGSNNLSILNMVAGAPPYRLTVVQPASGAPGTIVWPNPPVVFPGGVAPTLSTPNSAVDVFTFVSDGTNFYLITEGLNYAP